MSENSEEQNGEALSCRCPEAYPDWDGTDQVFAGRLVHRMKIPSFFHMPFSYDLYVGKQEENIYQLGLTEIWPGMVLARTGMWGGEIIRFIEDAQSPSRLVKTLAPPFDVNVMLHHGGIGTIQKTLREQQMRLTDAGRMPKEMYLAHLACPACEERKGGEKIFLIRRWESSKRLQDKIEKRA